MREYDSSTGNGVVCDYYLTETDTDPQLWLNVILKPGIGISVLYLKRNDTSPAFAGYSLCFPIRTRPLRVDLLAPALSAFAVSASRI